MRWSRECASFQAWTNVGRSSNRRRVQISTSTSTLSLTNRLPPFNHGCYACLDVFHVCVDTQDSRARHCLGKDSNQAWASENSKPTPDQHVEITFQVWYKCSTFQTSKRCFLYHVKACCIISPTTAAEDTNASLARSATYSRYWPLRWWIRIR